MLNLPPGAIDPESQPPPVADAVCAVLSLLVHVTVPPTEMLTGFGEYAFVVSVDDPLTIDTGVPVAPDEGVVGEFDDPHPLKTINKSAADAILKLMFTTTSSGAVQRACLLRCGHFTSASGVFCD
jgi:hypothetical protein